MSESQPTPPADEDRPKPVFIGENGELWEQISANEVAGNAPIVLIRRRVVASEG